MVDARHQLLLAEMHVGVAGVATEVDQVHGFDHRHCRKGPTGVCEGREIDRGI